MTDPTWFRRPDADPDADPGTGNAAYNALDRHVVHGRADEVAVELAGRSWTYADLLAESAAFAGVLRAFGVAVGDRVDVGQLPDDEALLVALAGARLGATVHHTDAAPSGPEGGTAKVAVVTSLASEADAETPVITVDGTGELGWDVVMRAGRTDPAGCADVRGDAALAVVGGHAWTLAQALGGRGVDGSQTVPDEVDVVDVGGVRLWWRRAGGGSGLPNSADRD